MNINPDGGQATGNEAVKELGRITSEREKYKRLLLLAFVLLWIIAVLIPVFAPPERTGVSIIASAVLIILSFGVIGSKNFIFKALGISVEAGAMSNHETVSKHDGMPPSDSNILDEK